MSDQLPRELIKWLQKYSCPTTIREIRLETPNGRLLGYILSQYFPKEMSLDCLSSSLSEPARQENWTFLERFLMRKNVGIKPPLSVKVIRCTITDCVRFLIHIHSVLEKVSAIDWSPSESIVLPRYQNHTRSTNLKSEAALDIIKDVYSQQLVSVSILQQPKEANSIVSTKNNLPSETKNNRIISNQAIINYDLSRFFECPSKQEFIEVKQPSLDETLDDLESTVEEIQVNQYEIITELDSISLPTSLRNLEQFIQTEITLINVCNSLKSKLVSLDILRNPGFGNWIIELSDDYPEMAMFLQLILIRVDKNTKNISEEIVDSNQCEEILRLINTIFAPMFKFSPVSVKAATTYANLLGELLNKEIKQEYILNIVIRSLLDVFHSAKSCHLQIISAIHMYTSISEKNLLDVILLTQQYSPESVLMNVHSILIQIFFEKYAPENTVYNKTSNCCKILDIDSDIIQTTKSRLLKGLKSTDTQNILSALSLLYFLVQYNYESVSKALALILPHITSAWWCIGAELQIILSELLISATEEEAHTIINHINSLLRFHIGNTMTTHVALVTCACHTHREELIDTYIETLCAHPFLMNILNGELSPESSFALVKTMPSEIRGTLTVTVPLPTFFQDKETVARALLRWYIKEKDNGNEPDIQFVTIFTKLVPDICSAWWFETYLAIQGVLLVSLLDDELCEPVCLMIKNIWRQFPSLIETITTFEKIITCNNILEHISIDTLRKINDLIANFLNESSIISVKAILDEEIHNKLKSEII